MKCDINGVIIRELKAFHDRRGWLIELFRNDELPEVLHPVMGYVSLTKPSVVRGPHEHREQYDYFCFIGPSTFRLYLWDNRSGSATFGQDFQVEVGVDNPVAVVVPPGVVHAYKNIGNIVGIVYNSPNQLYAGYGRKSLVDEIRYEDDDRTKFRVDE